MKTRILTTFAVAGILSSSFLYMACSDDNGVTEPPGGSSSGSTSSGATTSGDAGPVKFDAGVDEAGNQRDCFLPPLTTHLQIINACTDADKIVRTPTSTRIYADGGLPKP